MPADVACGFGGDPDGWKSIRSAASGIESSMMVAQGIQLAKRMGGAGGRESMSNAPIAAKAREGATVATEKRPVLVDAMIMTAFGSLNEYHMVAPGEVVSEKYSVAVQKGCVALPRLPQSGQQRILKAGTQR